MLDRLGACIVYLFGQVRLGVVHQSPSLVRWELSVKGDMCWLCWYANGTG